MELLPPERAGVDLGLTLAEAVFDSGRLEDGVARTLFVVERAAAAGDAHGELRARIEHARLASSIDRSITVEQILELVAEGHSVFEQSGDERALATSALAEIWAENSLAQFARIDGAANTLIESARRTATGGVGFRGLDMARGVRVAGSTWTRRRRSARSRAIRHSTISCHIGERRAVRFSAMLGRMDEARALLAEEREWLEELGLVVHGANCACHQGELEMVAGDNAAAEAVSEGRLRPPRGCRREGYLKTSVADHGNTLLELGRLKEAGVAAMGSKALGHGRRHHHPDGLASAPGEGACPPRSEGRGERARRGGCRARRGDRPAVRFKASSFLDLADVYERTSRSR